MQGQHTAPPPPLAGTGRLCRSPALLQDHGDSTGRGALSSSPASCPSLRPGPQLRPILDGALCLQPTSNRGACYSQPLALARAWLQPGEAREGLRTVRMPLPRLRSRVSHHPPRPCGPGLFPVTSSRHSPAKETASSPTSRGCSRTKRRLVGGSLGHYCFLLWETDLCLRGTDLCLRGTFKVRPEGVMPSGNFRLAGHRSPDKVTE